MACLDLLSLVWGKMYANHTSCPLFTPPSSCIDGTALTSPQRGEA